MQQPNSVQFIEVMTKEIYNHESRNHWEIVCRSTIPPRHKTIQAIWSLKRKCFPDRSLNKHKACLCAHGGMQQWGISYWETYSPVVNMLMVCLLLALCNIHGLESKSIDFVLAFSQANLDAVIWMELPKGIVIVDKPNKSHAYVLKLKKSLSGLKQASLYWFEKLKQGLVDRGFTPSTIDPCLYSKENMVILTYVKDCIIISPSQTSIKFLITSMQNGPENFNLTNEGDLNKFLGIEITKLNKQTFELSQPFLVNRILFFWVYATTNLIQMPTFPQLQSLKVFFIGICLESLKNMRGSIGLQLECSLISTIRLTLKFPWQLIKPLISQIS
jgi:hypothetical protein